MNLNIIYFVILFELVLVISLIIFQKFKKYKSKQPSLPKKIIKKLKF